MRPMRHVGAPVQAHAHAMMCFSPHLSCVQRASACVCGVSEHCLARPGGGTGRRTGRRWPDGDMSKAQAVERSCTTETHASSERPRGRSERGETERNDIDFFAFFFIARGRARRRARAVHTRLQ